MKRLYCVVEKEIDGAGYITGKKFIRVYTMEVAFELDKYPALNIKVDNEKSLQDALSFYYTTLDGFEIIQL